MNLIERLRAMSPDLIGNDAADAIERLTAELAKYKDLIFKLQEWRADELAERDALKADAERYRTLRHYSMDSYISCGSSGEELDAEIDAAIKGEKP